MPVLISYTLPIGEAAPSADAADGNITAIADHCADGLAVLLEQYQESGELQELICSYLRVLQQSEDDVIAMLAGMRDLDTAVGAQLDVIGRIVNERRDGGSDDDYRRRLRVAILVNRSDGKLEQLIEIVSLWQTFTGGDSVRFKTYQPLTATIYLYADPVDPVGLMRRLRKAKEATSALQLVYMPAGASATFRLSSAHASGPVDSATQGLSSTHSSTGGLFAGVVE